MSDDRSDDVLVMCAKAGDQNAFGILFLRHKGEIYVWLMQVVHSDEIAKDLWQDTYLKTWSGIQSLNKPSRFRAWLRTTTRNLAFDRLRREQRERTDPLDESTSNLIAYDADPTVVIETDCVRSVLAEMEPVLREVLILNTTGYSRAEIAHQLGYKESTITTYLSKARERFRQLYRIMSNDTDDSSSNENNGAESHKASKPESLAENDHSQESHSPDET